MNATLLRTAARVALDKHDALRAAQAGEPDLDWEGMPLDADAWDAWHRTEYKPAYREWDQAMDRLAAALGEPTMSRHPANFRPRCEAILR